ncbi:MAG: hypothetical protein CM15mP59_0360 [Flavobacteriaceae bacterium]|nr:MAG: hypothetical protein CM15mP59_0360 [Flavobacteriaceae bacterium]
MTYKLSGIHLFDVNVAWMQRAPHLRNTYANSRENHYVVGELAGRDLALEELTAFDVSYILRAPKLLPPHSLYTAITNAVKSLSFLLKELEETLFFCTRDFTKHRQGSIKGLSLDFEANVLPHLLSKELLRLGVISMPIS